MNINVTKEEFISLIMRIPSSLDEKQKEKIRYYYNDKGIKKINEIVVGKKIVPFAAHSFIDLSLDNKIWEKSHEKYMQRNERIFEILKRAFKEFEKNNCKSVCVVENFASVLRSKECIACFCSGDVDLTADIKEKQKIEKTLLSLGFKEEGRSNHFGTNKVQISQYFNETVLDGGYWLNVMWKPIARAFLVQDAYEKRMNKERYLASCIKNTPVRVLNTNALLYFCILHIACGHYYVFSPDIRLYVDLDRLIRNCDIDWGLLLKWAKEDNAGIRIETTLYLCHQFLDTPIPKWVIEKSEEDKYCKELINYLYDEDLKKIKASTGKISRLHIELASDGFGVVRSGLKRIGGMFNLK